MEGLGDGLGDTDTRGSDMLHWAQWWGIPRDALGHCETKNTGGEERPYIAMGPFAAAIPR